MMPQLAGARKEVLQIAHEHPNYDFAKIGRILGISRERVRQICSRSHIISPHRIPKYCKHCGSLLFGNSTFCNRTCFTNNTQEFMVCDECGVLFPMSVKSLIRRIAKGYQHFYCSKSCCGKQLSRLYGFGAHPENMSMRGRHRKYDYNMIWQKHLETGFGASRLSPLLGIPLGTTDSILKKMQRELQS